MRVIIGAKINSPKPKSVEENKVSDNDFLKFNQTRWWSLPAKALAILGSTATAIP